MRRFLFAPGLAIVLVAFACGRDRSDEDGKGLLSAPSLIPVAPAPQASSRPTPQPPSEEPLPAVPGGGDTAGGSGACGPPYPPAVSRISVRIYSSGGDRVMLDSTPLVGPDLPYCESIGFPDRAICPVRPDGHPERLACEAAGVGRASDTGRIGPTWTVDGRGCGGPGPGPSCENHPTNQFQVFAHGSGTFRACGATGVCGEIVL